MKLFLFSLLMAAPLSFLAAAPQVDGGAGGPQSFITTLIPFALIIGVFYFLIIRPQNKKQKETQRMLGALKKGDRVVTIGGIHGVVQSVRESSVVVKVDENVKLEFSRTAISSVNQEAKADKNEKSEKIEDKSAGDKAAEEKGGETAEESKN